MRKKKEWDKGRKERREETNANRENTEVKYE